MKVAEAFPTTFLKADDLAGQTRKAVITAINIEAVGDDRRLILSFKNTDKRMICNKTNANRISVLYGDETDDWIGKEIVIGSEFTEFQGRTVKGLRVKLPSDAGTSRQIETVDRPGYKLSTSIPAGDVPSDEIPF